MHLVKCLIVVGTVLIGFSPALAQQVGPGVGPGAGPGGGGGSVLAPELDAGTLVVLGTVISGAFITLRRRARRDK